MRRTINTKRNMACGLCQQTVALYAIFGLYSHDLYTKDEIHKPEQSFTSGLPMFCFAGLRYGSAIF